VRFTASRRFVVSTGGADRTILLWSHQIEQDESDLEEVQSDSSASSASSNEGDVQTKNEIADVGLRSLEQVRVCVYVCIYVCMYYRCGTTLPRAGMCYVLCDPYVIYYFIIYTLTHVYTLTHTHNIHTNTYTLTHLHTTGGSEHGLVRNRAAGVRRTQEERQIVKVPHPRF
jgi:hypothetical protein